VGEAGQSQFEARPDKVSETLSQKQTTKKKDRDMAQVVKHLHFALDSNPSTVKI
jgi:hypothetical protein